MQRENRASSMIVWVHDAYSGFAFRSHLAIVNIPEKRGPNVKPPGGRMSRYPLHLEHCVEYLTIYYCKYDPVS